MGTIIKASAVTLNGTTSSMDLAVQAGTACIETAGIDKNDIDVLINTGIYHDDNIMEPALSPLIQKRMGINPDPLKQKQMKFTFGFDLYNGACGFLNALQVGDTLIKSGCARNVLIVTSDSHPSQNIHADFPFRPLGAAVLLAHDPNADKGFKNFFVNTSDNGYRGLVGGADLTSWESETIDARKYIQIVREERFVDELSDFVLYSAGKYFKGRPMAAREVKFLVTSQHDKDFARRLYSGLKMNGHSRYVDLHDQYGDTHTSTMPLGFHQLVQTGDLEAEDTILFAAVGSGLTAAFAMYTA